MLSCLDHAFALGFVPQVLKEVRPAERLAAQLGFWKHLDSFTFASDALASFEPARTPPLAGDLHANLTASLLYKYCTFSTSCQLWRADGE